MSKSQIDRLAERLRHSPLNESDLRLLDDYRRSFAEAYEAVVRTIRQLGEFPTGRLAKSTYSIVGKLRRESLRLSQMQDIAGCRLVVANVVVHENFEKLHFEEVTATQLLMESREKAEKAAAEMIEHNAPEHELQEMQQQLEDLSRQIELRRRLTEELQGDLVRSRRRNADLLNWAISTLN